MSNEESIEKDISLCTESLKEMIKTFRRKNKQVSDEVSWTINFLNKLINKWEVFFAIDFFHIFEYAYPNMSDIIAEKPSPEFIQHRAALEYLFSNPFKKVQVILLPPYIDELKNHIKLKFKDYTEIPRNEQINQISEKFINDQQSLVTKACEAMDNGKDLDPKTYQNLVETIMDSELNNALFLLSGRTKKGLEFIINLIKDKKVIVDSAIISENIKIIETATQLGNNEIYSILNKIKKERSFTQNWSDNFAINIVLALNNHFKENNDQKIIYLMSDVRKIIQLFHWNWPIIIEKSIIEEIEKIQNTLNIYGALNDSIHRTTNIFLQYMYSSSNHIDTDTDTNKQISEEEMKETIKKLEGKNTELTNFDWFINKQHVKDIVKKCNNLCVNCSLKERSLKEQCDEIKKGIQEREKLINQGFSMSVLRNRFNLNLIEKEINDDKRNMKEAVKAIVYLLSNKNNENEFKESFDKKMNELKGLYVDNEEKLAMHLIGLSLSEIQVDVIRRLNPTRRIPFTIHFDNEEIKSVLEKTSKEQPLDKIEEVSSNLYKIVSNKEKGIEKNLFSAIINYNFDKHGNVNNLLNSYVNNLTDNEADEKNSELYQNCLLVYLLSQHQFAVKHKDQITYDNTLERCRRAIIDYNEDDKFQYMKGVIIRRGIEAGMEENIEEKYNVTIELFDNLICKYLKEPIDKVDKLFVSSLINSYAYTICIFEKDKEDINKVLVNKAFDTFMKIERYHDSGDREANFLDTKGLLYFVKAKMIGNMESKDVQEMLNKAKKNIIEAKKAAETARYFDYEKEKIDNHLKLIEPYLNSKRYHKNQVVH